MAGFSQFEDIEAWQKARILSQKVNEVTKQANFRDDYDLKRQIKRCAGSIIDNIAEGFERGGNKEFIHFLSISKGSAGEIRSQFYRSKDNDLINENQFNELYQLSMAISKMIEGLIRYLLKSELKGPKFKH